MFKGCYAGFCCSVSYTIKKSVSTKLLVIVEGLGKQFLCWYFAELCTGGIEESLTLNFYI